MLRIRIRMDLDFYSRIRIQCVTDRPATPPWKTQPAAEKAHNGDIEAHRGAVEAQPRAVDRH